LRVHGGLGAFLGDGGGGAGGGLAPPDLSVRVACEAPTPGLARAARLLADLAPGAGVDEDAVAAAAGGGDAGREQARLVLHALEFAGYLLRR